MFIKYKQLRNSILSRLKQLQFVALILLIALASPYYAQARIQQPELLKDFQPHEKDFEPILKDVTSYIDVRIFMVTRNIQTVDDYAQWLIKNMRYQKDADRDIWSNPSETLQRGFGDCEDLAFLTAEVLKILGHQPRVIAVGLKKEAHVVCMFQKNGKYHVFDNTSYYKSSAPSMKHMFKYLLAKKKAFYMLELTLNPKNMKVLYALTRRKS